MSFLLSDANKNKIYIICMVPDRFIRGLLVQETNQSAEAAHSRRGSDKAPNLGAFPADFIIAFTCREGYLEAIKTFGRKYV